MFCESLSKCRCIFDVYMVRRWAPHPIPLPSWSVTSKVLRYICGLHSWYILYRYCTTLISDVPNCGFLFIYCAISVQFSSVTQPCPTLCDPMNHNTPGLPVHHQLPEFTQTRVHRVSDAIQPSHPRSSPSPPAPNPSQHQSLFQWVSSSHEVAKVLEFQL